MIYLALLRGINVGGKNKVEMKKLKSTFEALGFVNVVTYINSGNIVFEESLKKRDVITAEIEKAIKQDFQLEIKVLLRNIEEMESIHKELPGTWVKNEAMRTDVLFLWEEFDKPQILEQMRINAVDRVKYVPGAVLWNIDTKDYGKSGISKLIGTKVYKNVTIRNVNTFRKLHQIMTNLNK